MIMLTKVHRLESCVVRIALREKFMQIENASTLITLSAVDVNAKTQPPNTMALLPVGSKPIHILATVFPGQQSDFCDAPN